MRGQVAPAGDWRTWVLMAGRGFGEDAGGGGVGFGRGAGGAGVPLHHSLPGGVPLPLGAERGDCGLLWWRRPWTRRGG